MTTVVHAVRASRVSLTSEGLAIDDQPALIQAGALHYFRLPHPDLWTEVLMRIRMAGLNAVFLPVPWAYHSPAPGFYDFTGPRNINLLLDASERAGLWLIPHIGPWIGAHLDAGGVPAWALRTPGLVPACSSAVPPSPSAAFLRQVADWWERLLPLLCDRSNLLMLALDPGFCTFDARTSGDVMGWLHHYLAPLLDLVRKLRCRVPCAMPQLAYLQAADLDGPAQSALPMHWLGAEGGPWIPQVGLAVLDLSQPLDWREGREVSLSHVAGEVYPRRQMAVGVKGCCDAVVLTPFHTGIAWGRWSPPGAAQVTGYGAPLPGSGAFSDSYYQAKRMAFTVESLGRVLGRGMPVQDIEVLPESASAAVISNSAGTVIVLEGVRHGEPFARLWRASGAESSEGTPLLEDIYAPSESVALFPYDWRLAGGGRLTATLEPVLHTTVAGRELVILRNEAGGEVFLPFDFRARNRRGPVFVERDEGELSVHFDTARIASVVLDGPGGTLQLLALDPRFSSRTWPLDDAWRKTPAYPAPWHPDIEEPARGVVIGPDFVLPSADGGFRFLASSSGFGYRWGPWRGTDPNTWLAPFSWEGPASVSLPPLTWDSRPGAPEALPDFDDRSWRAILPGEQLDMAHSGIDYGFAWYRARVSGSPTSVTLTCRHACDVFFNGVHIAALNPPPDYDVEPAKTLPVPTRYLRDDNVVALLVENEGRPAAWNEAMIPCGLMDCTFDGAEVRGWRVRAGLTGETRVQGFDGYANWDLVDAVSGHAITWHRASFDVRLLADAVVPLFLYLDRTPARCYAYLNGVLIARQRYPQDSQRRFWLPEGLLHRSGGNELLIAQWTRGAQPGIGSAALEAGTPMVWRSEAAVSSSKA